MKKYIYINIPNEEIKTKFKQKIREYYAKIENYQLNFNYVKECATYWDNNNFTSERDILFTLKEICKILNRIYKEVKFDEKNKASFHHIMFVVLLFTKFKCRSETLCLKYINPGKHDLFLIYKDCAIIVELKYNKTAEEALKCIIQRNYCDKFIQDKKFAVNNYILLGLNMNENKSIDMCCLINKNNIEDEIINIEE